MKINYTFPGNIIRDRWLESKCPKDVVVLHGPPRSKSSPALSPFVLKLETYLRMNKIPYQVRSANESYNKPFLSAICRKCK
jgi:hypothetical protein